MDTHKSRCKWCNKGYKTAGAYSNHMRNKHPEKPEIVHPPLPRRTRPPLHPKEPTKDTSIDLDRAFDDIQDGEGDYNDLYSDAELENAQTQAEEELKTAAEQEESEYSDVFEDEYGESDFMNGESDSMDGESESDSMNGESESDSMNGEPDSTNEEQDSDSADEPPQKDPNPLQYQKIKFHYSYKAGEAIQEFRFEKQRAPGFNHIYPFLNTRSYSLARFFAGSDIPKQQIDEFFKDDFLSLALNPGDDPKSKSSFNSSRTFYKQTSKMVQDPAWKSGVVEFPLCPKSEYKYRDILLCIRYLLRQRAFVKNTVWAPVQVYNDQDEREYSEMNTGTWWWDVQVCDLLSRIIPSIHSLIVHASRRVHSCPSPSSIGQDQLYNLP